MMDNGKIFWAYRKCLTRARELGLRVSETFLWTKNVERTFFARRSLLPNLLRAKKPSSLDVVLYLRHRRRCSHKSLVWFMLHTEPSYIFFACVTPKPSSHVFFVRRRFANRPLRWKRVEDFCLSKRCWGVTGELDWILSTQDYLQDVMK